MINLRESLLQKLRYYPNKQFAIVVNSDVVDMGSGTHTKIARVKYKRDNHREELILGYCKATNKKVKLINDATTEERIVSILSNQVYADMDLSYLPSKIEEYTININLDYAVVYLTSATYRAVKYLAMHTNETTPIVQDRDGNQIPSGTIRKVYDKFLSDSINAYHNVVHHLIYNRVLKRDNALSFYFLIDSYIPVNIFGDSESFIFNPFINIPKVRQQYEKSWIYKMSQFITKSCNGLTVQFLTPKEICKGFGLNKYVRFNLDFYIEVLGGLFSNDLPNPTTHFYVLKYRDEFTEDYPLVLTEEAFNSNRDWASGDYMESTTLEQLCFEYAKSLGVPKSSIKEFSDLMSKRVLINA